MIEAYAIAINLLIKGDALKRMEMFANSTIRAGKNVDKLLASMLPLNKEFSAINQHLRNANPLFSSLNNRMTGLSERLRPVSREFGGLNSALSRTLYRTDKLIERTAILKGSLGSLGASAAGAGAGLGAGSIGGGGRHGGFHGVGSAIAGHATPLSLGALAFSGYGMAAGAGVVGAAMSYKTGMKYQQNMQQLLLQNIPGVTPGGVNEFINNTHIPGVSQIELLHSLTDAASIVKDFQSAKGLAPMLAKINYLNQTSYKGTGMAVGRQEEQAAIQAAEIVSGSKDPKVLGPMIEMMFKAFNASGGRVRPHVFRDVAKGTRGFARGMKPEAFFYELEPLIQEFGSSVGSMIAQLNAHITAGRLTTASAENFAKLGLVDKKDVIYNKMGMIKKIKPGGMHGAQLVHDDPIQWIEKFWIPALASHGYTTLQQQMQQSAISFTNRDLTLVNAVIQQASKINSNAAINAKAMGVDQAKVMADNMSAGKMQTLSASLSDLSKALSQFITPAVNNGAEILTKFVVGLTKALNWGETGRKQMSDLFNSVGHKPGLASAIPGASSGTPILLHSHVHIDGERVASAVTKHVVGNSANPSGTSSVEPYFSLGAASLGRSGGMFS